MYLKPLDILVTINDRTDPYSRFKRWMMGRYDHVGMYLGEMGSAENPGVISALIFPAVFESVNRGILLRDLREWKDRKIAVMRISEYHLAEYERAIYTRALAMASDYGSDYDYPAIIRWAIPRIILQKLHIPIPQTWKRDDRHICSEAVYSVLEDAGLDVLPDTQVPLPGDFVDSPVLSMVDEGYIEYHPELKYPGLHRVWITQNLKR